MLFVISKLSYGGGVCIVLSCSCEVMLCIAETLIPPPQYALLSPNNQIKVDCCMFDCQPVWLL